MDRTTQLLTSYACGLTYEDLSPQAIHQVKRTLIDTLGCAIGGYLSEPAKVARRLAGTVSGTVRSQNAMHLFPSDVRERLVVVEDLGDLGSLVRLFDSLEPQVVINCTAPRESERPDPMRAISIFSLLPQRLAHLCEQRGARLVHISSDGVFSGTRGSYAESDLPDATDEVSFELFENLSCTINLPVPPSADLILDGTIGGGTPPYTCSALAPNGSGWSVADCVVSGSTFTVLYSVTQPAATNATFLVTLTDVNGCETSCVLEVFALEGC